MWASVTLQVLLQLMWLLGTLGGVSNNPSTTGLARAAPMCCRKEKPPLMGKFRDLESHMLKSGLLVGQVCVPLLHQLLKREFGSLRPFG